MAIVVEDGSGSDPAAYAFITQAEAVAYAALRGIELEEGDELDVLIVKSMDFIVSEEPNLSGSRTHDTQPLPYPRTYWTIRNVEVADDVIPVEVKNLQCGLIVELSKGFDFMPSSSEAGLRRKKTGPLEKEWFSPGGGVGVTAWSNPMIDALLAPLLSNQSGAALKVERI